MSVLGGRQVLLDTSVVVAPPLSGLASIADFVAVSDHRRGTGVRGRCRSRPRRATTAQAAEQLVVDTFDVIPFDIAVAQSYGLLANLVWAAGRDPRPWRLDLLIAATAERHGLSLATRNAAGFRYLKRVLDVVEVP